MIVDPRMKLIERKLRNVRSVIMFGSGKGGVGRSTISSAISYVLSTKGYDVAYVDLDFYGPAALTLFPLSEPIRGSKRGLELPRLDGVKVISIGYMLRDNPFPLMGKDKVDVLKDFFSILSFDALDFMIVDLPAGMGDELTLTHRLFGNKASVILVTLNSEMSLSVVERMSRYVKIEGLRLLGTVVNMADLFKEYTLEQLKDRLGGDIVGTISYHAEIGRFRTVKERLRNVPKFNEEISFIAESIVKYILR